MRRILLIILLCCAVPVAVSAEYHDHRGHDLDSLEHVSSSWTKDVIDSASDEQAAQMIMCWDALMNGYLQINRVRSEWYACRIIDLATSRHWDKSISNASKIMGQHMWAQEKYDSAAFWFNNALAATMRMAEGSSSASYPEEYDEVAIDDSMSSLYGALGNLYNSQDSLDRALYYYGKAEELFLKHDWKVSLSVLNNNLGETYLGLQDYSRAEKKYKTALEYARTAGDSLWMAVPKVGLGSLYLQRGKTVKAMRCLLEADEYFSRNEIQEMSSRKDLLDLLSQVYKAQKRHLVYAVVSVALLLFLLAGYIISIRLLARFRKEKHEAENIMEEMLDDLRPSICCPSMGKGEAVTLSEREKQVLSLIAAGKTNPQIAEQLFLSPETIKWYRRKLIAKFNAANSAELVGKAQEYIR